MDIRVLFLYASCQRNRSVIIIRAIVNITKEYKCGRSINRNIIRNNYYSWSQKRGYEKISICIVRSLTLSEDRYIPCTMPKYVYYNDIKHTVYLYFILLLLLCEYVRVMHLLYLHINFGTKRNAIRKQIYYILE